jgi:UDP-N-acetyl-D-glucosamine dehydrogenase
MTNSIQSTLVSRLKDRSARVAVIGIGYVGLPLAVVFADAGYQVVGIDPIQEKVDRVNQGDSYVMDVPTPVLARLVNSGRLQATTDYSVIREVDAVSICVPTPLRKTGDPNLSYIISATESLMPYLHPGMVVVLESSTYPGTTRELVLTRLQEASGLVAGVDFFLAFSPERVDPGRKDWTTINTPKVVGGITPACSEVASIWYAQALQKVIQVSTAEVAEMAKLLENTFRMINLGLVNELALMCDRLGVDVWEVIDAAASKPFGFMKFTPGPGVGGHCIPIDPLYLSWKLHSLNYTARFIELASEINTGMPRFVVSKVQDALNNHSKAVKGSRLLVLGAAYKPDIDDIRESPALEVMNLLINKGADVVYHDPYIAHIAEEHWTRDSVKDLMAEVQKADAVVIITNHKVYDFPAILNAAKLVVDTRNALGDLGKASQKVTRL